MRRRLRFFFRQWGWPLTAGGVLLCSGSSCALFRHKHPGKDPGVAGASAASAGTTAAAGGVAGRLIARSHVDEPDDAQTAQAAAAADAAAAPQTNAAAPAQMETVNVSEATIANDANGVPAALAERRIGVVRVIGAHGRFVLIKMSSGNGDMSLRDGQELRCRGSVAGGGTQTAVVKVSRERQPPFVVADVVSGTPGVGDTAYK